MVSSHKDSPTDILKEQIKTREVKETQQYLTELRLEEAKELSELKEDSCVLRKKFKMLRHYTKMVCRGISPLAVIRGSGGLGKSWNVTETLNEEGFLLNRDYVTISGHSTPLELFQQLYHHKDTKVILLDDVSNILSNDTSVSILKAATWGIKKRLVSYNTTSEKLTVPELFEMKAGIIIIVNEEPRNDKSFKALMTRGLVCEVEFTHTEVLSILKEVAVKSYSHLSLDKRLEVYKFIEDNVHIASQINIRTLIKSFQAYQYGKDWKEIIINLLKPNADLKLVTELIDKHHRVKDAVKEFVETGRSRATFFRLKAKLKVAKSQASRNG